MLDKEAIINHGYLDARELPSGVWIATGDNLYTRDIYYGLDEVGWSKKWMYEDRNAADAAFVTWNGDGDPPGPWLKQKPDDRWNPNR